VLDEGLQALRSLPALRELTGPSGQLVVLDEPAARYNSCSSTLVLGHQCPLDILGSPGRLGVKRLCEAPQSDIVYTVQPT
jgi:hypothetical protein